MIKKATHLPTALIVCFLVFLILKPAQAATITVGDLISTTMSTAGSEPDLDPSPFIDFRNLVNGNGNNQNDIGDVTSTADAMGLSIPSPGSFGVSFTNLQSDAFRDVNSGAPVNASSMSTQEITFVIAPGEVGTLDLNFAYTLTENNIDAQIIWGLTGPDADMSNLTGNIIDPTANGMTKQSIVINTAGTYTFTIETQIAEQAFENSNANANATVSNFNLTFTQTAVPEPSTFILGMLAGMGCLISRRRSDSS